MADQGTLLTPMPGDPQMGKVYDSTVAYSGLTKNTAQFQQLDPAGAAVSNGEGRIPTYSVATATFTVPVAANDIMAIIGSATKTIRVKRVSVSGRCTVSNNVDVSLIKRSTAGSLSTSTSAAITVVPHDTTICPAATAQVVSYSSAGSVSGGVTVRAKQCTLATATAGGANSPVDFQFGDVNDMSIILRSTLEALCISLGGGTVPAGALINMFAEFSEE